MEHAPLRPVVRRPAGPVDPDEAVAHVAARLPSLDRPAATALALVEVAGRSRADVAAEASLGAEELAEALARARKELRRSLHPLPGSGWCERAERLISDRLDEALEPPGPARLEVHLRNCPRCVEHDRRLAQATEGLLAEFVQHEPEPVPAPEPEAPAPELKVVDEQPAAVPAPAAPVAAPQPTAVTPAADRVDERLWGRVAALAWNGLFALAVILAIAAAAVAVLGALGGSL